MILKLENMFPVFFLSDSMVVWKDGQFMIVWVSWVPLPCALSILWRLQQWLCAEDDNEKERKNQHQQTHKHTHNSHDHRLSQKCAAHEKCLQYIHYRLFCVHIFGFYFLRNFKPATEATTTKLATKLDHRPTNLKVVLNSV